MGDAWYVNEAVVKMPYLEINNLEETMTLYIQPSEYSWRQGLDCAVADTTLVLAPCGIIHYLSSHDDYASRETSKRRVVVRESGLQ